MVKFTLVHEIPCDTETFWKIFFDKEYNDKLYRGRLEFPKFEILEQKDTGAQIHRKAAGQPKMDLPGPLAKLLGPGFSYVEDGTLDKATNTYRWKLVTSTLSEKIRNEGVLHVEPAGDGKIKRIVELSMEAKVFGLGGMLEKTGEKSMRDGWEGSAVFLREWIQKHA